MTAAAPTDSVCLTCSAVEDQAMRPNRAERRRRARLAGQALTHGHHPRALCFDCGIDTISPDGGQEYYRVKDEIWAASGLPTVGEMVAGEYVGRYLCIGCLEQRIGRRLTRADFNGGNRALDDPYSRRSARLVDRLSTP
jgi:hypothetical protein